jgi:hypothetical protein
MKLEFIQATPDKAEIIGSLVVQLTQETCDHTSVRSSSRAARRKAASGKNIHRLKAERHRMALPTLTYREFQKADHQFLLAICRRSTIQHHVPTEMNDSSVTLAINERAVNRSG